MITTANIFMFVFLGLIVGGFLVIVFVPFTFTAEFIVSSARRNGIIHVQWLHPKIVRLIYDIQKRQVKLNILGWMRILSDKDTCGQTRAAEEPGSDRDKRSVEFNVRDAPAVDTAEERQPTAVREHKGTFRQRLSTVEKKRNGKPGADKNGNTWRKFKTIIAVFSNSRVIAKSLRWCRRTLRMCSYLVRFDHLHLHAKAGAGDPAETGKIYGWYTALNDGCFRRQNNVNVQLEPQFSGDVLEFNGSIGLRTSLARIGVPLMVGLVTFPYLSVYFVWRRLKKRIK